MPKVLIAGLAHETHSFVEDRTTLADFAISIGEELWSALGDCTTLAGVLDVALERGWDVIPVLDLKATPSGIVEDAVLEFWWTRMAEMLVAHPDLDGIFLVLHGAMVAESYPDVEGELLFRTRDRVGPAVPIAGVTDLHANFSQRMADNSNVLVTYRENPHVDGRESAVRAAHLLDDILKSGTLPTTVWHHPPIIWQPTGTATAEEPMQSLEVLARKLEEEPDILSVNIHAGFAFADMPDAGVSFSIVTTNEEAAHGALRQLSELAMRTKELGNQPFPTIEEVMPQVKALIAQSTTPVLLVEPADNIGGGAPGDDTAVLHALLEHRIKNSAVAISDADAVAALWDLPVGTHHTLDVGGKGSALGHGPLHLKVELVSRSEGEFQLEDEHSHMAALSGRNISMGRCVVVRCEDVTILLTTYKMPPMDLGQLRSQGIVPESLAVIGVKAAVAHRQVYNPIAAASFTVDTPGPCSSNLRSLPFRLINRPVYPLDD